ncbi:unnamed protein product [Mytilus coruscus]|uniref:MRC n=1 Tax=Mytilus coruscus TaxID=42192 RepID=A0A6J8D0V1_MYTCO|nr:unnamed protein product [Mytilus coruscus]
MWCLALQLIFVLNADIVSAYFFINPSEVTWKDAQKLCNVPTIGDIIYTKRDFTELPEIFTAWTSSRNTTSDWTSFYGCLDASVNMVTINETKRTLNKYFPDSTHAVESETVFKCAYFCTTKGDIFTFFRHVCKCIYETELKSQLVKIPVCIFWDSTKQENVDDVYSISRRSLPIFKFETDLQTKIIQKGDGKPDKYHCLAKTNGTLTANDCTSKKKFTCEGGKQHYTVGYSGYGTWTNATYKCLVDYESLLKNQSIYSDYWLRYFMYEEDKENQQCVAIRKNGTSLSLTYQFRPCSDRWPVLCKDEHDSSHISTPLFVNHESQFSTDSTESTFTSTNLSDVQRPGVKKDTFVVGEIVVVNVVLFGLCILFVSMIKLRNHLNMQLCQTANQKLRRKTIHGNHIVQRDENSQRDNGVSLI